MPNRLQFSTASRRSYFFLVLAFQLSDICIVSEHTFASYIKPRVQFCTPSLQTPQTSTNRQVTSFLFPCLQACYVLDLRSALYRMASHCIHSPHYWISHCASGSSAVQGLQPASALITSRQRIACVLFLITQRGVASNRRNTYFPFYIPKFLYGVVNCLGLEKQERQKGVGLGVLYVVFLDDGRVERRYDEDYVYRGF
jgi:hypothetical protein